MSEFYIKYGELDDIAKCARKVGDRCISYQDELTRKLSNKLPNLPASPMSSGNALTGSATGKISQKKRKLDEKKADYHEFAGQVDRLKTNAQAADRAVAKSVNYSRKNFLNEHKNFNESGWNAFFANLVVKVPVLGWLAEKGKAIADGWQSIKSEIRYWYEVCGGKKLIDSILAVGEVVLAVVGLVAAIAGLITASGILGIIAGIAGVIAAVITLANAGVNFWEQMKANSESDPAWAAHYGNINSVADGLRTETFESKWLNRYSEMIATGIEVTELVCSVISIGNGISEAFNRTGLKKLFSSKTTVVKNGKTKAVWKFDFTKFKNTVGTKEGRSLITKTLKRNRKGVLVGDKAGWEPFKKKMTRAFKSNDWKKKSEALDRLLGIGKSGGKIVSTLGNRVIYGYSGKGNFWQEIGSDAYSIIKGGYDIYGGSGSIKNADSTIEGIKTGIKMVKVEPYKPLAGGCGGR